MAEIDPVRRAEIGREKRARTRAALVKSACILFASHPVESVTVDDVVKQAGVARGTFYSHFVDLPALVAAVELELVDSLDELLQPARLSIEDPLERLAFGCSRFLGKAAADPAWARLVARLGTRVPVGSETLVARVTEDLRRLATGSSDAVPPALGLEIVLGLMLWFVGAYGEGRLAESDRDAAIAAVLRAVGAESRTIRSVIARLPPARESRPRGKAAAGA